MNSGISILALNAALAFGMLSACAPKDPITAKTKSSVAGKQDLCLENANVYTAKGLIRDAAIVVSNGKVVQTKATSTGDLCGDGTAFINTVDLKGAFVYPGLVDSHVHLLGVGLREMTLNLEGTPSISALQKTLAAAVAKTPKGQTVYGRGWIETHWPEGRFPSRQDLDTVAPDHPVLLQRADGHAMVANTKAIEMAGITNTTKSRFGGKILRAKDGSATGMFIDNAMNLLSGLQPKLTPERKRAAYIKGSEVYAARGWTGIQSMSVNPADVPLIEELSDAGLLKIRVYNAVDVSGGETLLEAISKNGPQTSKNGRVVTRAIKLYADGALGSRGAALLAPYSDDKGNSGLMLAKHDDILPILERALRNGIQVCVHAIGDKANRKVLDWYEEAFNAVPVAQRKVAVPRWRIEHSQIISPSDIKRFADLDVIASMQPSHAIGDLHFAVDRLGVKRLAGGYAWHTLIENGVKIAGGSDAPVEIGDPRIEFYAGIARKDTKGFSGEGWYPNEKMSREQTLKIFTQWAAYAGFSEDSSGVIAPGKNADFTVFNKDIMTIPEHEILSVTPVLTLVAGEIAYQAKP